MRESSQPAAPSRPSDADAQGSSLDDILVELQQRIDRIRRSPGHAPRSPLLNGSTRHLRIP
jgi:hypothetical protein